MKVKSNFASLLKRIRGQYFRDQRTKLLLHLRLIFFQMFISIAILIVFRCPNLLYNSWKGPFIMNLQQLRDHLETNYNLNDYGPLFSFRTILFEPEYLQVELGEDAIGYHERTFSRNLLYTFHRVVEPAIDLPDLALYVKFAAYSQSYSNLQYPYRFQSFSVKTLRCIVKQINIPEKEFIRWPNKVLYVEKIEEIYKRNPSFFNKKVIKKCGILLGYLYRPTDVRIYDTDKYDRLVLKEDIRIFDASCHDFAYHSHALVFTLICIFLYNHLRFAMNRIAGSHVSFELLNHAVRQQLLKIDDMSLEKLDNLLLETTSVYNYLNNMFIIKNKYLVMLMVDFDEKLPMILRKFYRTTPFFVINIHNITQVLPYCVVIRNNGNNESLHFPLYSRGNYHDQAEWLHTRLRTVSTQYEYFSRQADLRDEEERQRHLQQMIEEIEADRLERLTLEETQHQRHAYGNDFTRMLFGIKSASPRLIAEYRMNGPLTISDDLMFENCAICISDYQINRNYARWSCPAQHMFHFHCILDVLRAGNKCPMCRHPVEAANIPHLILSNWLMTP